VLGCTRFSRLDLLSRPSFVLHRGPDDDAPGDLGKWLPAFLLESRVRNWMERTLGNRLSEELSAFASRLRDWSTQALAQLTEQFDAQSELLREQVRHWASAERSGSDRQEIGETKRAGIGPRW
jgi:hypothetical protein